jgi:hypothetical protein
MVGFTLNKVFCRSARSLQTASVGHDDDDASKQELVQGQLRRVGTTKFPARDEQPVEEPAELRRVHTTKFPQDLSVQLPSDADDEADPRAAELHRLRRIASTNAPAAPLAAECPECASPGSRVCPEGSRR